MSKFGQDSGEKCEIEVLDGAPLWQFPNTADSGERWAIVCLCGRVAILHRAAPAGLEALQFLVLTADPGASLRLDRAVAVVFRIPELTTLSLPATVQGLDEISAAALHAVFIGNRRHPAHQRSALAFAIHQLAAHGEDTAAAVDVVADCLQHMQQHLEEPLTLDGLAAHCGLSKSRLTERFHERENAAPMKVLSRLRMDRAQTLLMQTDMTVSQVAAAVGYPELSTFSRAFSRAMGKSPSAYRNAAQWLV